MRKIYNMVDLEPLKAGGYRIRKDLGEIIVTAKTITAGQNLSPSAPRFVFRQRACSGRDPGSPESPGRQSHQHRWWHIYGAAPDQPPFVQVGDTVKKGDVVLIIESMKLMNEVTSDVEGVVQEILVKNGDAVEYDQPLMILA
ncbi:MAG: acetyl-CoA carboxylase biotin carboxyl carrier protein [Ruminococcus sp.]